MEESKRLKKLPVYVFARLDKLKAEQVKKGADLIDLGMGNPDVPPPQAAIDTLVNALKDPQNHRYPSFEGIPEFKQAAAAWCKRQYGIEIDAENEVTTLIGSKEGVVHFAFAVLDPGDTVLVPMPAYPAHFRGPILAGAEPIALPTPEENGYLPDLDKISKAIADKAKILYLSYPTNPTGATAPKEFFEKAVAFCKKHDIILLHDFAYAEVYFEGKKPISCLSIPGAKDVCIEFHSTSKTFGMPGWRCGFAVGNADLIELLRKIKTNLDYGLFQAVQRAAITALSIKNGYFDNMRATYQKRRDIFVDGLNSLGWKVKKPMATMYVWFPIPKGKDCTAYSVEILEKTGVVLAPGTAFGDLGEGYIRAALVVDESRIIEAIERLKKAGIKYASA